MLVKIAVLGAYFVPPIVGFVLMRSAARGWWPASRLAVKLFFIAVVLHVVLFAIVTRLWQQDPVLAAWLLPPAMAAVLWNLWRRA